MDIETLTLTAAPVDIGASLSASTFTRVPPIAAFDGRGAFRLYNASTDSSLYVAIQDAQPNDDTAVVRVLPQSWFPLELQVRPAGGVWAWASRAGTKAAVWVTRWS